MRNRFLVVLLAFGLIVGVTNMITAQDKEAKQDMQQNWGIAITLDTPNLIPPAVQWAIFDSDPLPGFENRIRSMRDYMEKRLQSIDDPAMEKKERDVLKKVSWDKGFQRITGDLVNLLTTAPNTSYGMSSNAPAGKKWIVSKIVQINGEPICWCLPIEVKPGPYMKVTLSEENAFDLAGAFAAALEEQPEEK